MTVVFKDGYNYLQIESFRLYLRSDFYLFDVDKDLIDNLRLYLSSRNIKNNDWNSYNLFNFEDKSIELLRNNLLKNLKLFCKTAEIDLPGKIYALGWLNILEPGDTIKTHFHSLEKFNFFSCNISLDDYNSTTTFHVPWVDRYDDNVNIANTKGKACIFPSWLWHGVYNVDQPRLSLGIDFYTEERMQDYFKREHENCPAPIQYAVQIL